MFISFGNRPGCVAFGGNHTVTFDRFGNSLRISAMRFGFPAAIWVEPPIVRVIAMRRREAPPYPDQLLPHRFIAERSREVMTLLRQVAHQDHARGPIDHADF